MYVNIVEKLQCHNGIHLYQLAIYCIESEGRHGMTAFESNQYI